MPTPRQRKMTTSSAVKLQVKRYEVPFALACYCISSISMTLMNKFVLSSHKFKMNFLLLALQVYGPSFIPSIHVV